MNKRLIYIVLTVLIGYYPASLLLSHLVWYETDKNEIYIHKDITIRGVKVVVWTGPTASDCRTSLICPLIKNCVKKGPYYIGISVYDKQHTTSQFRIKKAVMHFENGQRQELKPLKQENGSKDAWVPFKEDALNWAAHMNFDKKILLDDSFKIELDVDFHQGESVVGNQIAISLQKQINVVSGWVVLSSWI